jgi:putative phosphoesterase
LAVRIAVLSDIHGNPIALDAVLSDVEAHGGADEYLVLGDLVAIGHDPVAALERLTPLPNVRFVQGNTDRYITAGDRPFPSVKDAATDPKLLPRLVEVAHTFAWTQGALTSAGWFDFLARLPLEQRFELPDGTRVLAVHVAPGKNDGAGIHPKQTDEELATLLAETSADLVCVGHTHWPLDREVGGIRVVNCGSVSNPVALDLRASYALIEATERGYQIELRRVAYNCAAVIEAIELSRHPAGEFIISHYRAQRYPWWAGGLDGQEHVPLG